MVDISLAVVYCGARRNGKTLSMTIEGVTSLINGENVWSNYPIEFDFRNKKGDINHYKSYPIDMPDLLAIQKTNTIRDGKILLDEWNLFCNARRSGALSSVIFSGVVQLIGKRNLSLYISAQDFQTLDRNIRWQCDITVECFDLFFKYRNLKKGSFISQTITDWSGVLTGHALKKWDDYQTRLRNTQSRIARGTPFFDCYPTGFEYDVLDVMSTKYNIERQEMVINPKSDKDGFRGKLIDEMHEAFELAGVERVPVSEIRESLASMGITDSLQGNVGRYMKHHGFKYCQGREGQYYQIIPAENGE
jgi:hypothetical protein